MDLFDYELPRERIAQFPSERRGASRLLVIDRRARSWRDARFPDIVAELAEGDLLVVNETAVFPARLRARRRARGTHEVGRREAGRREVGRGGEVEILLVRPLDTDDPGRSAGREWEVLARPARKAHLGSELVLLGREGAQDADGLAIVTAVGEGGIRHVRLELAGDPWRWIERHGHIPLPPYIDRPDEPFDRERYQTVYARNRGAVAAPTAGLHFTPEILARLTAGGIERAALTLHVGPGTFRPVTAERAEEHAMQSEWFEVPSATAEAIARTRSRGGRIVAVGTTVVRALESAGVAWRGQPCAITGWAEVFIRPGHAFEWVDALVTNFHLPRSTLLLLVAAFADTDLVLAAYHHAIDAGYRFYSYGDAMLIV